MKIPLRVLVPLAFSGLGLSFLSTPAPSPRPDEPKLADLAWMAGHWLSEANGMRSEEVWLAPAGGFLLGMNRGVPRGEKGSFEFLRIEERKNAIVYVASPSGGSPTDFTLADFGARFALFENPKHDFPQKIRYELDAAGTLHARVSGMMNGKEEGEEFTWKLAPGAAR